MLQQAIAGYNAMREAEGARLCEDIVGRLATIEALTGTIEERSPDTVAEYRERLSAKMKEVLQSTTIDESRLITEAAIFADKVAIDEETVRLAGAIWRSFATMLESDEPVGRKLDFLVQELNREANTIGSKCQDVSISPAGSSIIKAEIEKIREQVQNIE